MQAQFTFVRFEAGVLHDARIVMCLDSRPRLIEQLVLQNRARGSTLESYKMCATSGVRGIESQKMGRRATIMGVTQ